LQGLAHADWPTLAPGPVIFRDSRNGFRTAGLQNLKHVGFVRQRTAVLSKTSPVLATFLGSGEVLMQFDFQGRRVLIVEDSFIAASEIAYALEAANATVLGPCGHLEAAEMQVMHSELAILDIDIRGRTSFALADRLQLLDVPYVFFTGYDRSLVPERFRKVDYIAKPTSPIVVLQQLNIRAHAVERPNIVDLIPMLRQRARVHLSDPLAADRLVERTLQLAIEDDGPIPGGADRGLWLRRLMDHIFQAGSAQFLN
jgi:CheY-like chemotaxis protein